MTDDDLRKAIDDTFRFWRNTSPDAVIYKDVVEQLRSLMAEQKKRSAKQIEK